MSLICSLNKCWSQTKLFFSTNRYRLQSKNVSTIWTGPIRYFSYPNVTIQYFYECSFQSRLRMGCSVRLFSNKSCSMLFCWNSEIEMNDVDRRRCSLIFFVRLYLLFRFCSVLLLVRMCFHSKIFVLACFLFFSADSLFFFLDWTISLIFFHSCCAYRNLPIEQKRI